MESAEHQELRQQVLDLQEEIKGLRAQLSGPDLKAFEQIRELRETNKKLTAEIKRVTTECVQLAFKGRQSDTELKKTQAQVEHLERELESSRSETAALQGELDAARNQGEQLGHSLEELRGQLHHSQETALTHESELARQKEELARRQEQAESLRLELEEREGRINNLERLIHEFKEQYLSGEYISAASIEDLPSSEESGSRAYQVMVRHLEGWLGFAGPTIVDQVYELTGVARHSSESSAVETVFEALQDTAAAYVAGTEQQGQLEEVLGHCWEELQGVLHGIDSSHDAPTSEPEPTIELATSSEVATQEEAAPVAEESEFAQDQFEAALADAAAQAVEITEFAGDEPADADADAGEVVIATLEEGLNEDELAGVEEQLPLEEALQEEFASEESQPEAVAPPVEEGPAEELPAEEAPPEEAPPEEAPAEETETEAVLVVEEINESSEAAAEPALDLEFAAVEAVVEAAAEEIVHEVHDAHDQQEPQPLEEESQDAPVEEDAAEQAAAQPEAEETAHEEVAAEEEEATTASVEPTPVQDEEALQAEAESSIAELLESVSGELTLPAGLELPKPLSGWQRKQEELQTGLALVESAPERAIEVLTAALEIEGWCGRESEAELALAVLKRERGDFTEHLLEALTAHPVPDLYDFLKRLGEAEPQAKSVCDFLALTASSSRSAVVAEEGKYSLSGRTANRELIRSIGNEEEEKLVEVLLEHVYTRSGLKLPLPSPEFSARRDVATPAAFVGTLRQALRLVDYTLFDFQQLDVVSYEGDDLFLVDGALEPGLTLMFHKNVEGMPPEEVRFLAFRRLVQLYRRHVTLAHLAASVGDGERIALTGALFEVLESEGAEGLDDLRERSQDASALFEIWCEAYGRSQVEAVVDLAEWLSEHRLLQRRLYLIGDRFGARVCGLGHATYASLREELLDQPEQFAQLEAEGLASLFSSHDERLLAARLRVQRLWAAALQGALGYE